MCACLSAQYEERTIGPQAAPAEVRPLTAALDTLFGRLAEGRDAQRRFVENAAHQLRTPLAGLKGQIELALGVVSTRQHTSEYYQESVVTEKVATGDGSEG